MSREIKFRGISLTSGEWVEGWLREQWSESSNYTKAGLFISWLHQDHNSYDEAEVIPKTVGQFTGLLDKSGKEIYEGDIVHIWSKFYKKDMPIAEVFWNSNACFDLKVPRGNYHNWLSNGRRQGWFIEIIGSIHTHPELLEGES